MKLYIDEIGALRGRPRNPRAEALAAAAGLSGLSIHGDAFVGRTVRGVNQSFPLGDLSSGSSWAAQARAAHQAAAAAAGHGDSEHLTRGEDSAGRFAWSQTDEEVEVRVRGAPSGSGAAKRVSVSYGAGDALAVHVDKLPLVVLAPLFDRVDPEGCAWTLDGGDVVVSMEKSRARPWASLTLSGAH